MIRKKLLKRTVLYGEYVNEIMSLTHKHSKKIDGIKEINDKIFLSVMQDKFDKAISIQIYLSILLILTTQRLLNHTHVINMLLVFVLLDKVEYRKLSI